jgi:tripartite-type tricarboxylate transporter receptor subunit TctC
MEMFKASTGISLSHVPYRGSSQAIMDVVTGRIPVMFSAVSNVLPFVGQGKLRGVGVLSKRRSPLLPSVTTLAESGLPNFDFTTWGAIYAPQATPKPIVDLLNAEIAKAVNDSSVRERLVALGLDPAASGPERLAAETRNVSAARGKIIKEAGIRID